MSIVTASTDGCHPRAVKWKPPARYPPNVCDITRRLEHSSLVYIQLYLTTVMAEHGRIQNDEIKKMLYLTCYIQADSPMTAPSPFTSQSVSCRRPQGPHLPQPHPLPSYPWRLEHKLTFGLGPARLMPITNITRYLLRAIVVDMMVKSILYSTVQ